MPNQVNLVFAGDADKLAKASKMAEDATKGVGDAAISTSQDFEKAAKGSDAFLDKTAKLGATVDGASTAIDSVGGTLQSLADAQDAARAQSVKLERAMNDAKQAQQDYNQAVQDGKQAQQDGTQAGIDFEQAQLDASVAQKDYNAAVKEFGANSDEAKQAQIDLKQAQADSTQAQRDQEQAALDGSQALVDAKGAVLDLSDANAEANPGQFQQWADKVQMFSPLLSGLVGIFGLVTAAQWAWNAAQAASPIVWVIGAIAALVAIIVLIATQTNWFSDIWNAAWGGIKTAAEAVWNWIKQIPGWIHDGFAFIGDSITAPFKAAFNGIAWLWNNTVGQLTWDVPDWVPGIGGSHLGVPKIPTFHTGGTVDGPPGTEILAMLQAGERVIPAGRAGDGQGGTEVRFTGNTSDALATVIMALIRQGRIQIKSGV